MEAQRLIKPALIIASNLFTATRFAREHRLERPKIVVRSSGFHGVTLSDYRVFVLYDPLVRPSTLRSLRVMELYE